MNKCPTLVVPPRTICAHQEKLALLQQELKDGLVPVETREIRSARATSATFSGRTTGERHQRLGIYNTRHLQRFSFAVPVRLLFPCSNFPRSPFSLPFLDIQGPLRATLNRPIATFSQPCFRHTSCGHETFSPIPSKKRKAPSLPSDRFFATLDASRCPHIRSVFWDSSPKPGAPVSAPRPQGVRHRKAMQSDDEDSVVDLSADTPKKPRRISGYFSVDDLLGYSVLRFLLSCDSPQTQAGLGRLAVGATPR